jgi:uncharacterized phage infection (PIP) family protein YhgE
MTAAARDPSSSGVTQLWAVEEKLYSDDVVSQVEQLPDDQKQAFVSARLAFTSALDQLGSGQIEAIGQQLAQQSSQLAAGIADLTASLGQLDDAASWAGKLDDLLELVDQAAPDLA